MSKPKILVQLDADSHASVFDSVVAVDSGVEHLFRHHNVAVEQVQDLVHGAMFTRGPDDLHSTAIFIGGSNVAKGEALLKAVTDCFFGPLRVSVMLDSNGANTTAAAAVLAATRHTSLADCETLILGGTGPVGSRAARLIAAAGGRVRLGSRTLDRATSVCEALAAQVDGDKITATQISGHDELIEALVNVQVVIAAGAAGVVLLPEKIRRDAKQLKVAIDLNAVPPLGIEGIEVMDQAVERDGVVCYGAIGVGGLKMKIHRKAVQQLFAANDQVLDAEQIHAIGAALNDR